VRTTGAAAPSVTSSEAAVDDEFLSEQLKGIAVPDGKGAVMVAVVDAAGAVDYASKGSDPTGRPLGPEALFRTGSITKMFTGVLVLWLVDAGVVDLDSPATEYVARVPVPEGVTVRDSLEGSTHHTMPPGTTSPVITPRQRQSHGSARLKIPSTLGKTSLNLSLRGRTYKICAGSSPFTSHHQSTNTSRLGPAASTEPA
jgi:hypothetical protein